MNAEIQERGLTRLFIKTLLEMLLVCFFFMLVAQILEHYGVDKSSARKMTALAMIVVWPFVISPFFVQLRKRQGQESKQ